MTRLSPTETVTVQTSIAPVGTGDHGPAANESGPAPFAWVPISVTATAMCALEFLAASRYGFHSDELYFLACAHHLAWGYVDQPPLVPAVARTVLIIFGPSVFWLRVIPAIAGAATSSSARSRQGNWVGSTELN